MQLQLFVTLFNNIMWSVINVLYSLIDTIYDAFVKLNGINVIEDLMKDPTLSKAYNYMLIIAIVVLGFFAVWNFMKLFLEPDNSPPAGQITLEIVKCTLLVVLSTFILSNLFYFATVFTGAISNIFIGSNNKSLSSSIVNGFVEVGEDYLSEIKSPTENASVKSANDDIKKYNALISSAVTKINQKKSTLGVVASFNENTGVCELKEYKTTTTNKNSSKKSDSKTSNNTFGNNKSLPTISSNSNSSSQNIANPFETGKYKNDLDVGIFNDNCEKLEKAYERKADAKMGNGDHYPVTKKKNPFDQAGVDPTNKSQVSKYLDKSFKGKNYSESNWMKKKMWSWYYVIDDGAFGLDALGTAVPIWGGNFVLLLLMGFFLCYAMFFSGITLARRQIEMLLVFFISPMVFACSICNKQRRQSLYETLASLVLQAGAIMMTLGVSAVLISKISSFEIGTGGVALLVKAFLVCGVATIILTGSQFINRFIGANVSANAGREAIQSMMGFSSALRSTAGTMGAGGLIAGKMASHPVESLKAGGNAVKSVGQNVGAKAVGMGAIGGAVASKMAGGSHTRVGSAIGNASKSVMGKASALKEGANLSKNNAIQHLKNTGANKQIESLTRRRIGNGYNVNPYTFRGVIPSQQNF